MIACIPKSEYYYEETLQTLLYSELTSEIKLMA